MQFLILRVLFFCIFTFLSKFELKIKDLLFVF